MAVMDSGRVQLQGAPAELIERARGRIWTKANERNKKTSQLISTRLLTEGTLIHVLSDTDPGDRFAVRDSSLDDVYLSTLPLSRRAA
jgi:hypothetical protein